MNRVRDFAAKPKKTSGEFKGQPHGEPSGELSASDHCSSNSPQDLERMRRNAELLISTVARTGRAMPQDAALPPALVAQASAARAAPEPVHVTPQHSTKGRKLTAEEELAALAGVAERPTGSAEGVFAKVAQMAQAAESAAPAPIPMQDRPPQASPPAVRATSTFIPASFALCISCVYYLARWCCSCVGIIPSNLCRCTTSA